MFENLVVRKTTVMDIPSIVRICSNTFREAGARVAGSVAKKVVEALKNNPDWLWVAVLDGRVVGFLNSAHRKKDNKAVIALVGVDSATRGKGVGGKLLAALEAGARKVNCVAMRLGTPFARKFYEKYGFTCVKTEEKFIVDLRGKSLPDQQDGTVVPLSLDDVEPLLDKLPEDKRSDFVSSAYQALSDGFPFRLCRDDQTIAVGVLAAVKIGKEEAGRIEGNLMALGFRHTFPECDSKCLLQAAMYCAGNREATELGVALDKNEDSLRVALLELGFVNSEHQAFYTLYTMQRDLT